MIYNGLGFLSDVYKKYVSGKIFHFKGPFVLLYMSITWHLIVCDVTYIIRIVLITKDATRTYFLVDKTDLWCRFEEILMRSTNLPAPTAMKCTIPGSFSILNWFSGPYIDHIFLHLTLYIPSVGPIYGSVLYQFFGQALPFLLLAATVGLTICKHTMI